MLSPTLMKIGYRLVTLSLGSIPTRKKKYVHELVAAAFIGPRPAGHQINHIDGNKQNNRVENLEYVTHAENGRHASEIGLMRRGIQLHNAKLGADDIREIRRLRPATTLRALGARFGISSGQVHHICTRKIWKHID